MNEIDSSAIDVNSSLVRLGAAAKKDPVGVRAQLQELIYQLAADDDEYAHKLGVDIGEVRKLLADSNHELVRTNDAARVIKMLLDGLSG